MYEHPGAGALNYFPCRYGNSKLMFRGPRRRLEGVFCAMTGGTETYGKFVKTPFPALVEELTGHRIVNLGCANAGPDIFSGEAAVLNLCAPARVTVVQVLGAQNMSNRFYAVHPRRNDRFLRASPQLKALFPEVDFTEFHFTRHMLTTLKTVSLRKFAAVEAELKTAWVARLKSLTAPLAGASVLLHVTGVGSRGFADGGLGPEPLFVDDAMVAEVAPGFSETVRVRAGPAAVARGTAGMVFSPLEEPAAMALPGPEVHAEIAAALAPVIDRFMAPA